MGDEESDIDSCDGVIQSLSQLKIEENSPSSETMSDASGDKPTSDAKVSDDTFLSPDTASIGSTSSEEALICHHNKSFEKLNDFLLVSNIPPIQRRWMSWDEISEKTRQRYTRRGAEILPAVLQNISPENAGSILQAVSSSSTTNRLFGISEVTIADQRYLNVLAESYKNASSWETRKQILSTMTDLASYSVISSFIPGITKYRYTAANLHRLQFVRGVPVPAQTSVRVRVDLKQLDHFL
jgi:L-rhamnose mutarotase